MFNIFIYDFGFLCIKGNIGSEYYIFFSFEEYFNVLWFFIRFIIYLCDIKLIKNVFICLNVFVNFFVIIILRIWGVGIINFDFLKLFI